MKILVDTNIVLDVLLSREPWLAASKRVWEACDEGLAQGHVVSSTLTDIYYVARKIVGRETALQSITVCLEAFVICPVDRATLEQALQLVGNDFEDNVQIAAAERNGVDLIVTRNPEDFMHASLPVLTPDAFILQL